MRQNIFPETGYQALVQQKSGTLTEDTAATPASTVVAAIT
jgi:hypothetical protein